MKKTTCNMCAKDFNEFDRQENLGFHNHLGYGSIHDEEVIDLDICCECFDKMMDEYILPKCKIQPFIEPKTYYFGDCEG